MSHGENVIISLFFFRIIIYNYLTCIESNSISIKICLFFHRVNIKYYIYLKSFCKTQCLYIVTGLKHLKYLGKPNSINFVIIYCSSCFFSLSRSHGMVTLAANRTGWFSVTFPKRNCLFFDQAPSVHVLR